MKELKVYTTTNVTAKLDQISKGGMFKFETNNGVEVGVIHGRFQYEGMRVKFLKSDIKELREWVKEKEGRRVMCCFSQYLPDDLRKLSVFQAHAPIVVKQNTTEDRRYYKLDIKVEFDEAFKPNSMFTTFSEESYKGKEYIYAC